MNRTLAHAYNEIENMSKYLSNSKIISNLFRDATSFDRVDVIETMSLELKFLDDEVYSILAKSYKNKGSTHDDANNISSSVSRELLKKLLVEARTRDNLSTFEYAAQYVDLFKD